MAKTRQNRRGSRKQRGGMCPLAVASIGAGLGVATQQALQQGGQFAANTRTYHGGMRTQGMNSMMMAPMMGGMRANNGMMTPMIDGMRTQGMNSMMMAPMMGGRRSKSRRMMYGAAYGSMSPMMMAPMMGGMRANNGMMMAPMMGGRRRKSRRMMYGGMMNLDGFGQDGAGTMRASAHLAGQDAALAEAAAFSRTLAGTDNPAASSRMVGGKRRGSKRRGSKRRGSKRRGSKRQRGGNAPIDSPYTLLADDPALQRAAAQVENPAWHDVAKGTFA